MDNLASAQIALNTTVLEGLKRERHALLPLLQTTETRAEAVTLLKAYIDMHLPHTQVPMFDHLIHTVLLWVQWQEVLYGLVEAFEIKEPWALDMLV